ncbi:MAG: sigma-70 family RNA polymerase sigma factor [Rhodospirillaceae bacterium]|nr:sigma-70 family RNA polymerase sigma factor [Rhodospirillaceae bacterium]
MRNNITEIETELIAALRQGESSAFEQLVRTYGPKLLATANRILQDRSLAEDCVQEAFVKVHSKFETFEERSSLSSWLHRIVINQSLMKLRSIKGKKENSIDSFMPEFDENICRIEAPWRVPATPSQIMDREETRRLVHKKVNELPDSYRIVLILRDIEEMDTKSVADVLGMSEGAVKVRLHRARAALKKLLEPILREEMQ